MSTSLDERVEMWLEVEGWSDSAFTRRLLPDLIERDRARGEVCEVARCETTGGSRRAGTPMCEDITHESEWCPTCCAISRANAIGKELA